MYSRRQLNYEFYILITKYNRIMKRAMVCLDRVNDFCMLFLCKCLLIIYKYRPLKYFTVLVSSQFMYCGYVRVHL